MSLPDSIHNDLAVIYAALLGDDSHIGRAALESLKRIEAELRRLHA